MFSGRALVDVFRLKFGNPNGIKGKYLVKVWEKVLVTSEYVNSAKHMSKPCLQFIPNHTCEMSAVTCMEPFQMDHRDLQGLFLLSKD